MRPSRRALIREKRAVGPTPTPTPGAAPFVGREVGLLMELEAQGALIVSAARQL